MGPRVQFGTGKKRRATRTRLRGTQDGARRHREFVIQTFTSKSTPGRNYFDVRTRFFMFPGFPTRLYRSSSRYTRVDRSFNFIGPFRWRLFFARFPALFPSPIVLRFRENIPLVLPFNSFFTRSPLILCGSTSMQSPHSILFQSVCMRDA